MAILSNALRQAFMPKHEYETLRDEDRVSIRIQRPLMVCVFSVTTLLITVSTFISLKIVFPSGNGRHPFCRDLRIQPLSVNVSNSGGESDRFPGAFYLTDQETVDYYWMVVFVPSAMGFGASAVYLVAEFEGLRQRA